MGTSLSSTESSRKLPRLENPKRPKEWERGLFGHAAKCASPPSDWRTGAASGRTEQLCSAAASITTVGDRDHNQPITGRSILRQPAVLP